MTSVPVPPTYKPQTAMPPARRRRLSPWLVRVPLLLMMIGLLSVIVLGLFFGAFQLRYQDRIYPGVQVMDIALGDMTYDEALLALTGLPAELGQRTFTLQYGGQSWSYDAADIGIAVDTTATLAQAYSYGHSESVTRSLMQQWQAWRNGITIAPVLTYDQSTALDTLQALAGRIDEPVQNAALDIQGEAIEARLGRVGRSLDVAASLALVDAAVMSHQASSDIALVVTEATPLIADATQAAERLRVALLEPIELVAFDSNGVPIGPWTASPEQISGLLDVAIVADDFGTQRYDVSVDVQAFSNALQQLAPGLAVPARDARFRFDEATGTLDVVQPATTGREVDVAATLARVEEAVFSNADRQVTIAFDNTLPTYHNRISAAELGITELISQATTTFRGSSQNRRTNIALGASRIDGVLVAPGEEFSFNDTIGVISEETGWAEGKVIFGNRTISGIGGGICQVSTTLFRTVFDGGLPITERNSHGYRVGYYEQGGFPPGLDAAIWQPDSDFRFVNSTPYHILIESSFSPGNDSLQFRFYSTPMYRTEVSQPLVQNITPARQTVYEADPALAAGESRQIDYAAEGADVTVERTVYNLQGDVVLQDRIFTHYLPWAAVIEVAPSDPRVQQQFES